ncbi:hypothetical protein [Erwinia phage FBB1]|nr:hypothetical protein [Erwinia phage FBB1]
MIEDKMKEALETLKKAAPEMLKDMKLKHEGVICGKLKKSKK